MLFLLKKLFSYIVIDHLFINKLKLLTATTGTLSEYAEPKQIFKSIFKIDKNLIMNLNFKKRSFFKKNSDILFNKSLFLSFLYLNTWLPTPRVTVHPSFNIFYFFNKNLNFGCFNVKKIFSLWNNIITFITNIFFYNINCLAFGTSYFRYEILALNWSLIKFNQLLWKYTQAFTFFLSNKTTLKNRYYFSFLLTLNYRISFVSDIYYHRKTIYYFNLFKYISVGPIPISSNFYLLTLALPVSSNFLFSNLFFFRLLLKLKKNNSKLLYENYKNIKF